MSSLRQDQIPNKPLNGEEVKAIAAKEFLAMLDRECMLTRGIAYRRVAISFSATFHLGSPHQPLEIKSRTHPTDGAVEGEAPLIPEPEDAALVAVERDIALDNPNLARVHHDLPIKIQERMPPRPITMDPVIPGEPPQAVTDPYSEFKNTELRYDKTQYPDAPPPVDRDMSEAKAAALGVKSGMGLRERKK